MNITSITWKKITGNKSGDRRKVYRGGKITDQNPIAGQRGPNIYISEIFTIWKKKKTEFPRITKQSPEIWKITKNLCIQLEAKDMKLFSDNNHNLTSWIGYPQL